MLYLQTQPIILADSWLAQAMTSQAVLLYGCLSMASLAVVLLLLSVAARLRQARPVPVRKLRDLGRDDGGTATMEFALVFPVLLFFSLLLAQTTLMMTGNLFVNYSAYMATRAAIVQIPRDLSEDGYESANQYANDTESPKNAAILRAAAYALMPVAGRATGSTDTAGLGNEGRPSDLPQAMTIYYRSYGRTDPAWIEKQLAQKANYALKHTKVIVARTEPRGNQIEYRDLPETGHTFGPRDPITVQVEHKFALAFPYVSVIFSDGRLSPTEGGGLYSKITATCTLTNEGIIDALPTTPSLRNPQSRRQ